MPQRNVFGRVVRRFSWGHLCFWCRHFSKNRGSHSLLGGGGDQDGNSLAALARVAGFASGGASSGRMVVMCRFVVFLLMAGLFVCSGSAWAQISLVNVTSCGQQTFPSTCTIPATGNGHLIAVGWKSIGGTGTGTVIGSMTDNAGNSYSEAGAAISTDSTHDAILDIWYANNSIAGATSLTITPNPTGIVGGAVIWEFSGVATISPLDSTAVLNNQVATLTPLGAGGTTAASYEVILSAVNSQNAISGINSGNAFTNDSTVDGAGWAHLLTTSMGSYQAQWAQGSPGTYSSSTVAFRAAGSYSACDLNQDQLVNIEDVQLGTDDVLDFQEDPSSGCAAPFGQCNLGFVQAVLADAMGGACVLPVLGVAPSTVSFGNIADGSTSAQTATLTGTGTSSTTISEATVSGSGFSISGLSLPLTLAVGQTASFNVTFTPAATGTPSGSITFVSSALDSPLVENLSGSGLAVLSAAPTSISFGNVTVGTSSSQTVTLTSTGAVNLNTATVSGSGFSISGLSVPQDWSGAQSANFTVTFTPTAAGTVSGNVALGSSALVTPVNLPLSGTGVTGGSSHSVSLTWTPSTTSDVASYNIYRITSSSTTAPATPYPSLASVSATTCSATSCTYTDTSVTAGTSYWYYAAAVDTSNNVSAPSNIVQAVVPTP